MARLVAVLEAEHVGGDGDVVVDVLADRLLAALDRRLVVADVLGDLGRRAEGEAERAETELARLDEGGRARAGDPDGRVGLGVGLGQHVPLRHAEVLPLERVGLVAPHARDLLERLAPHGLGLGRRRDGKARPLRRRRAAAGAELDPTLGEMIHDRDALGDARRVVHRGGDVDDRGADVDALGPRRHPGEVDLGRRLVGVVLQEVVLGRPVVLEARRLDRERDLELAEVARVLVVPRRDVHLREDPELHGRLPWIRYS